MAGDFEFSVGFKIDNKGFLTVIDQATGKSKKLDKAVKGVGESSKKAGTQGVQSFKNLLVSIGAVYLATKTLKTGFDVLVKGAIVQAASFETLRTRLETFTGSAESARKRIEELADLAANTPLQIANLIEAEINLRNYGGALLAINKNMIAVGNAATATGAPLSNVSNWFGRAYDAIQNGGPLGEVVAGLRDMKIAFPETIKEVERLRDTSASANEVWDVFTAGFDKYTGSMERGSQTLDGVVSTISDNFKRLLATAGESGPLEVLKSTIKIINEEIVNMNANTDTAQQFGFLLAESMLIATEAVATAVSLTGGLAKGSLVAVNIFDQFVLGVQKSILSITSLPTRAGIEVLKLFDKISQATAEIFGGTAASYDKEIERLQRFLEVSTETAENLDDKYKEKEEQAVETFATIGRVANGLKALGDRVVAGQQAQLDIMREQTKEAEKLADTVGVPKKSGSGVDPFSFFQEDKGKGKGGLSASGRIFELETEVNQERITFEGLLRDAIESTLTVEEQRQVRREEYNTLLEETKMRLGEESLEYETLLESYLRFEEESFGSDRLTERLEFMQMAANATQEVFHNLFQDIANGSLTAQSAIDIFYNAITGSLVNYLDTKIQKLLSVEAIESFLAKRALARKNQEVAGDMVKSASGQLSAYSSIPWVGIALAIAGILVMKKIIGKEKKAASMPQTGTGFATGGLQPSVPGGEWILAGEGPDDEIIAPVKNFKQVIDSVIRGDIGSNKGGTTIVNKFYGPVGPDELAAHQKKTMRQLDKVAGR